MARMLRKKLGVFPDPNFGSKSVSLRLASVSLEAPVARNLGAFGLLYIREGIWDFGRA